MTCANNLLFAALLFMSPACIGQVCGRIGTIDGIIETAHRSYNALSNSTFISEASGHSLPFGASPCLGGGGLGGAWICTGFPLVDSKDMIANPHARNRPKSMGHLQKSIVKHPPPLPTCSPRPPFHPPHLSMWKEVVGASLWISVDI